MKINRMNIAKTALMGLAMIIGLASCSNDDNAVTPESGEELEGLDMKLTFNVAEAQTDNDFTRATPAQPQTDRQTFMGMDVETSVTEDKAGIHPAQTRATVYNTVDLEGKKVYAYVYNPSTGEIVAGRQTLTVTGGKLTVRGKHGCKILFYIGNIPLSASIGSNMASATANQDGSTDPMQCVSEVITTADQNLGTLTFNHVFSKLRVVLKTSDGTPVNAFSLTTKEKIGFSKAKVNLLSGSSTPSGLPGTKTFAVTGNTTSSAVTDYQTLIVGNTAGTPTDLTLVFKNNGDGATIGGFKNYLTDVNNTLKLKPRVFQPGHRYSINITLKPSNTDQYLNRGFRADKRFYQWDAYEPYGVGDSHTWSAGNFGIHKGSVPGQNYVATQSCKNCPSADEIKMYLGAGVMIDDGHSGPYQQSYAITNPFNGEKVTYHAGAWLKKKQNIAGFDAGTAPKATSARITNGRPTAETISQYFFLPFYGYYDCTNGPAYVHYGANKPYDEAKSYFMCRTANISKDTGVPSGFHINTGYAFYLKIDFTSATFGTFLNWTSANLASANIWSAD